MVTKLCGVYKILNIITRDYYLGGAVNIRNRWYRHRWELAKNIHGNTHLQNAWNKYGEQAFEFTVILLCDREHKLYFEDGLIKLFKPAYNIATNALAPMQGRRHSEATLAKMSTVKKGNLHPNFGKHHTAETRAKMSGRIVSEETRAKLSETHKGKHPTEETRVKMSKVRTDTHPTEETRAKLSEITTLRWAKKKAVLYLEIG